MNWLCRFGFHKNDFSSKFIPSIHAKIVTEYIYSLECRRCHKREIIAHEIWDTSRQDFFPKHTIEKPLR